MTGRLPWVTLALISLCLGVAVLLLFDPNITRAAGFNPASPSFPRALASLFLHQNVWHLLGNLVFLASVGPLLEFSSSRWKMPLVFLLAGLGGVAAFWLMKRSDSTLIGASGAVAGLIGYASVRHMGLKVPLLPGKGVPAWGIAAVWVALQGLGAVWRLGEEGGGISFWSHLGGFLVGLLLAAVLGAGREAGKELGHEVLDQMNERGPVALLHAAEDHLKRHPKDPHARRQRLDALKTLHEDERAQEALMEMIEDSPSPQKPFLVRELDSLSGLSKVKTLQLAKWAEQFKGDDPGLAKRLYRVILERAKDRERPEALLKLAELLEEGEERSRLLSELEQDHSGHGAAAVAKAKGLIDP